MRKGNYCDQRAGYLKLDDFVQFIEKNPSVKNIELSNSGEVFLNPDLLKIIEYAFHHHICLTAQNGVNFNTVSDKMLEALVKFQFQSLTFSIDGASQEIYSKYRRNGNYDTVINNIRKLNEYKKQYNSNVPVLRWQYVLMETNDRKDEIRKAMQTAASLNASIVFRYEWGGYISKNLEMIRESGHITGIPTVNYRSYWTPCYQLWTQPQINWDGRFYGCCVNASSDFGINIFETGLKQCLASPVVKKTKKMLMGLGACHESPCYQCQIYEKMKKDEKYITPVEVGYSRFSLMSMAFNVLRACLSLRK
ncbi:hypothetical protein FACS1894182_00600 [Bacteroidia bacterium]|nr:hypothetical protein FACS1894182_00600 [Bacteroidia bacterium]